MQWHHAVPVLRVFDVTTEEGGISSQVRVRNVEIHGDVDHWYLPVEHAPRTYKVQIGYRRKRAVLRDGPVEPGANAAAGVPLVADARKGDQTAAGRRRIRIGPRS